MRATGELILFVDEVVIEIQLLLTLNLSLIRPDV
jgi:hypothetical protein